MRKCDYANSNLTFTNIEKEEQGSHEGNAKQQF
jgi:hypothetical protein